MQVSNPWVSYITRSYQQVKASLIQGLTAKAPEVTDHSESNILIIIISMFSGVAEMLGYYIDNAAREAYILSARKYASMIQLTKILDYRVKASNPSTTDVTITFSDPVPLQGSGFPYFLPVGIEAEDSNGIRFISQHTSTVDIPAGSESIIVPVIQQLSVIDQLLGTSDGATLNQQYQLPSGYVDMSMVAKIGGIDYTLVETFAYSFPQSTHYIVLVDETGTAFLVLGDGSNGKIPGAGQQIIISYKTTSGASGNLPAGTITTLVTDLTPYLPATFTAEVTNLNDSTGGAAFESIEDIRKRAPLSIRTLSRAVTAQDYVDIALLHPGVSKADTNFVCGKSLDIFIVPINGGIAQTGLLASVLAWLDTYKMVGTFPIPRAAGVTNIVLSMDVTLKFRADPVVAARDIKAAIKSFFSLAQQDINKAVYKSALQALIQTISTIEYMNITKLTTLPYPRLIVNPVIANSITEPELRWAPEVTDECVTESDWTITYKYDLITYPAGKFIITRNGIYEGEVLPSVLFISPSGDIKLTCHISSLTGYKNNQAWEFTTYPYNEDHQLNDFTIPAVRLNATGDMLDVNLTIIQQLTP